MHGKHIALGALFGFILSRAGATSYDAISGMFRLTDLHLFGVIGLAVAVSAAGFFVARKSGARALNGEPMLLTKKPMTRGLAAGALLFGLGWGLSGTCPGTALAQIGEGTLAGLVTFSGIVLGAWMQGRGARRRDANDDSRRATAATPAE